MKRLIRFHGDGTRRFNDGNVYNGNYVDGKRLMGLGGIIIAMAICKLFWFMSANSV